MYVFLLRDRKGSLSALKNFLIFNERYEAGCRDLNPWHGVDLGVLPIMLISICSRLYLDSTRTEATLPMIPKRPTPSWKWLLYYILHCTEVPMFGILIWPGSYRLVWRQDKAFCNYHTHNKNIWFKAKICKKYFCQLETVFLSNKN